MDAVLPVSRCAPALSPSTIALWRGQWSPPAVPWVFIELLGYSRRGPKASPRPSIQLSPRAGHQPQCGEPGPALSWHSDPSPAPTVPSDGDTVPAGRMCPVLFCAALGVCSTPKPADPGSCRGDNPGWGSEGPRDTMARSDSALLVAVILQEPAQPPPRAGGCILP